MRIYFCLLIGFLNLGLAAQSGVHFDRPFHVAGEVAWFAVYPPTPAPPKVRTTVYAPDGTALNYFFLEANESGQYRGFFRFPFTAETGYFRLGFEAMTARGEITSIGTVRHPVYADKRVTAEGAGFPTPGNRLSAGGLSVSTGGGQVTIEGLSGEAYSLSVVNKDVVAYTDATYLPLSNGASADGATPWVDTLFYAANVMTADGKPLQTNLLPLFDAARYQFGFTKSDAAGDFTAQLGPFEGSKTLQARTLDGTDIKPSLKQAKLSPITEKPTVTEAVASYIDLSRRRRKIYQLYATIETEVEATVTPEQRRTLLPNRDFNVQDYKRFPDMYNFFKEVGGELRVKIKKGNYTARLYNAPNQRFFKESPLYIVDGMLTNDDNYANQIDPAGVNYLAYYYIGGELRRNFPALGNNGVVLIDTKRRPEKFPAADADDIFTVNGLQPDASFQPRDATQSDVPALSPLLLWRTGTGQTTATFDLPATDDVGEYQVIVVARSASGGVRTATADFTVAASR